MSKAKSQFVCQSCGASTPRWLGRCPQCGEWSSLVEEVIPTGAAAVAAKRASTEKGASAQRIGDVPSDAQQRRATGLPELDRVLGGGLVPGGVILVGGDPGIGKSTLLMQVLASLAARGVKALYVTAEESAAQVAIRARRLGSKGVLDVDILASTELELAERAIEDSGPTVVVLDSIQTVRAGSLESPAGSVGQLREVTSRLVDLAKRRDVALFLIGHVTKEGALAGPKVLEHLVDTVLSFEGDRTHAFRVLRSTKNRFGPAQETAVFEMVREGLREVPDPSAMFLAERPAKASGSVVTATAEGSRPLLVEVQALVAPAVYGSARRVATGLDGNRLAILLAVLERKAEIHVLDRDVFASVAGGARVDEPALDLALAVAVVSSLRDRPVARDVLMFGEVGLAGEVRAVPRAGPRVVEAGKLGFRRLIVPYGNVDGLSAQERKDVEIWPAKTLADALSLALDG